METPSTDTLNEQASAWFARLRGADLTPEDRDVFDRWMDNPRNAVAYARVEAAWDRAERLQASRAGEMVRPRPQVGAQWTRRAAALGAVSLGGAIAWRLLSRPEEYATALGEHRREKLPDGSIVELNTGSRVQVDFSGRRRAVRLLSGEALFDVAKDPKRPFVVAAGEAEVRAVGTAFNVRLREHLVEVTVTEGIVQIDGVEAGQATARRRLRQLPAGRAAVVGPGAVAELPLDPEALQRRVAWCDGIIELRGETLEQAVEEFNRYRTAKLVVGDPTLAGLRIGGTFGTHEADKFLGALRSGFNVRAVEGEDGTLYLLPAA